MAPRECPMKATLSIPSRFMSATRSAVWTGMPAGPSTLPVSPRPRRSTARNRQPASPPDSSSSTSARKASARPVRPWTSKAVLCAPESPQETVYRSAAPSLTWLLRLLSDAVKLAAEHLHVAGARIPRRGLLGHADLRVGARELRRVQGDLHPTALADREAAAAHALVALYEPELVVLIRLARGHAPRLEPHVHVLPRSVDPDLPASIRSDGGRGQGGRGDLLRTEESRRVQRRGIPLRTLLLSSCGGVWAVPARSARRSWARRRSRASSLQDMHPSMCSSTSRSSSGPRAPITYGPSRSLTSMCSLIFSSPVLVREHALAQGAQRRRRPALDGPEGRVGLARDLALREAPEVRQDQHLPVGRGEPRERRGHIEAPRELACGILLPRLGMRRLADGPDPGAAATDQVRRPVAGDAVDPGSEARPRRVEARRPAPHSGEDVLDEVLRERPVPEVAHPRAVDQARVT